MANQQTSQITLSLGVAPERFPIFCLGKTITVTQIDIIPTQRITYS